MARNTHRNFKRLKKGGNDKSNGNEGRNPKPKKSSKCKTLDDHMHHVGSAKQASDFVTAASFLINCVRRGCKKGKDIANSLENFEEIDFEEDAPAMGTSQKKKGSAEAERENKQFEKTFEIDCAAHGARVNQCANDKATAAALLWNQSANSVKAKLGSRKDCEDIKGAPIPLLSAIKLHVLSHESNEGLMKMISDALKMLINLHQRDDEIALDHPKRFKTARDVFPSCSGKEFCFPRMVEEDDAHFFKST